MKTASSVESRPYLVLHAASAADLMAPNPVSISADASVKEAAAFLVDKGFSAAPVIDSAGRPIGVLSQSDLVLHTRERVEHLPAGAEYDTRAELSRSPEPLAKGFEVEDVDRTQVRDIMTPVVFSVAPDTSASRVIEEMLAHKVHRMYVVDALGILVGVISTVDVLRHLRME